jgi:alpha-1,2-mannosyltransferase
VDAWFYQRFVFASYNIVQYNVLDSTTSSELYGVAPLSFYVKNLLLNFNVALPFATITPLLLCRDARLLYIVPTFLWLALMLPQPHKEERFLFVVYPLLLAAASISLARLERVSTIISRLIITVFIVLSISRSTSIATNYAGKNE